MPGKQSRGSRSADEILAPLNHDVYEIEELVAEGAEAHVYAKTLIVDRLL